MDDQVKKLDRGVDVLIATPGRLMDHFELKSQAGSGTTVIVRKYKDKD